MNSNNDSVDYAAVVAVAVAGDLDSKDQLGREEQIGINFRDFEGKSTPLEIPGLHICEERKDTMSKKREK